LKYSISLRNNNIRPLGISCDLIICRNTKYPEKCNTGLLEQRTLQSLMKNYGVIKFDPLWLFAKQCMYYVYRKLKTKSLFIKYYNLLQNQL